MSILNDLFNVLLLGLVGLGVYAVLYIAAAMSRQKKTRF